MKFDAIIVKILLSSNCNDLSPTPFNYFMAISIKKQIFFNFSVLNDNLHNSQKLKLRRYFEFYKFIINFL